MKTTLATLREHQPCKSGEKKLINFLGREDGEVSFSQILESNGIKDAIWCLRVLPDYNVDVMHFKLICARRVEHLDITGVAKNCLDVLDKFISGNATRADLKKAASASYAAAAASYDAYASASYTASVDASYAAAYAADASADASSAASYDAYAAASYAAERDYQTTNFKTIFCEGDC